MPRWFVPCVSTIVAPTRASWQRSPCAAVSRRESRPRSRWRWYRAAIVRMTFVPLPSQDVTVSATHDRSWRRGAIARVYSQIRQPPMMMKMMMMMMKTLEELAIVQRSTLRYQPRQRSGGVIVDCAWLPMAMHPLSGASGPWRHACYGTPCAVAFRRHSSRPIPKHLEP